MKECHREEQRDVDPAELLNEEKEEEDREKLVSRRLLEASPFGLLRAVFV
jgi:hypothetical protein